jgi:hypothetical protein
VFGDDQATVIPESIAEMFTATVLAIRHGWSGTCHCYCRPSFALASPNQDGHVTSIFMKALNARRRATNSSRWRALKVWLGFACAALVIGVLPGAGPPVLKVTILGQVRQPGRAMIKSQGDLKELFEKAGGLSKHSDATRTQVIRIEGGKTNMFRINAILVLEGKEVFVLKDKDLVVIPEKRDYQPPDPKPQSPSLVPKTG